MKLLLDTHAVIWAFHQSPSLGRRARALLAATAPADCGCCDVSLSEAARLIVDQQLTLAAGVTGESYLQALAAHVAIAPVTPRIAWLAANLQWAHKDPCDRHIVETALERGVPLLTVDRVITHDAVALGLKVVW